MFGIVVFVDIVIWMIWLVSLFLGGYEEYDFNIEEMFVTFKVK